MHTDGILQNYIHELNIVVTTLRRTPCTESQLITKVGMINTLRGLKDPRKPSKVNDHCLMHTYGSPKPSKNY